MNKLFTKVAALTLGVAMAAGVGVAVGASKKASAADAAQATITPSQFTAVESTSTDQTVSDIRFELENGTITSSQFRLFKGKSVKITAPANNLLTSVEITCTASGTSKYGPGCMKAMTGYSYSDAVGTWTGSASNITFTSGTEQVRITQFVVNYEPEQTDEPKITLSEQNINFVMTDSASAVTVTPNSAFAATPTISIEGTPAYVNVAVNGLSLSVSPKAVGNETVTVKATNNTQVATATFTVKVVPSHGRSADDPYTVPEVIAAIDDEYTTFGKVYVAGIVSNVEIPSEFSGSLCYYISADGTTTAPQFKIYWGKGLNNQNFTSADDVQAGASIVNYGAVVKYNSEYEFSAGSYLISYESSGPDLTSVEIGGSASAVAGKSWNYDGVTVTAHYSDQSTKDVKEFCTVVIEEAPVEAMTSATVKVTYKDQLYTETIPVSVSPAPAPKTFAKITSDSFLKDDKYLIVFEDSASETPAPVAFDASLETLDATGNNQSVSIQNSVISADEEYAFEIASVDGGYTIKSSGGYYIGQTSDANGLKSSKTEAYVNTITFESDGTANIGCSGTFLRYNNASNQTRFRYYKSDSYTGQKAITLYRVFTAPVPTEWTEAQEDIFEENLDGYVPPYFATLVNDIEVSGNLVQYTVSGEIVDEVNEYYDQQGWQSPIPGYWRHETTNGHGVVDVNALKVNGGTSISFQYTEYAVVTLDENGTKTNVKLVPPVEYTLPSPKAELIPAGKEFKAWEIGGDYYDPDDKYSVSQDVTITAVYQDIPAQKYTVTYTAGQGTGENYVVSDVEAGSSHTLVAFATAGFTAPAGQQFKGWQVGDDVTVRDAGYVLENVASDVTVTAIYEEIPVQKFTITYKSGYGTGEDIVISDVEAGSSHTLKTFAETQFVAPAGQQFKGWRIGSEATLHDAGYEITNIQADVNIFANYEDIPVTDWSDEFKAEYTSRFGSTYMPPFVDPALAGDEYSMYWYEGYPFGMVAAEGDYVEAAINAFNGVWPFVGDVQNEIYIFRDPAMRAFVHIVYDSDDGYTLLNFCAIGNVALEKTGVKTEYFVGDAVDTTNLEVHPMLMDGTVIPLLILPSTMWTVSPSTFTEAGAQEVTVTIPDFFDEPVELTYDVNVTAVVAQSITVSGQAAKTSYTVGEDWSAEGLVVTAHYNNGTEAPVTDQVTWSFDPAETALGVTSVSAVAHLGDLSSDAFAFDVTVAEPKPTYDADAFAKDLLDQVAPICANYDGKKNNKLALRTVWETMSARYSELSNEEKAKVIATVAKTDGTDLQKAMAFYDYACKKYGLTKFIKDRPVKALIAQHETGNSILPIVVIVASSVAAITAIGVVIALKRRKALLAK